MALLAALIAILGAVVSWYRLSQAKLERRKTFEEQIAVARSQAMAPSPAELESKRRKALERLDEVRPKTGALERAAREEDSARARRPLGSTTAGSRRPEVRQEADLGSSGIHHLEDPDAVGLTTYPRNHTLGVIGDF
jgi:hypothetical protein